MKPIKYFCAVSALMALATSGVMGYSIQFDSLTKTPSSLNLNNYQAFAYYGDNAATPFSDNVDGMVSTDLNNVGGFSGAFETSNGSLEIATGDHLPVSFSNGQGTESSASGDQTEAFLSGGSNGAGLALMSTLFAPKEVFQFYVATFDSKADFEIDLTDPNGFFEATFTLSGQALPTYGFNTDTNNQPPNGSGNASSIGLLTTTITGNVGDMVTFSEATDGNGVSDSGGENIAIIAATASAPEPPVTWMMVGGVFLVTGFRHFSERVGKRLSFGV